MRALLAAIGGIAIGVGTTLLGWPFTLIALGVVVVVAASVMTPDGWAPK